eukprot:Anaeramoba_ignava/a89838_60.p1 GENE.a89838_60~~a89838_60.p1  ORF type:complete len:778 (+),score=106.94 a89838_60:63-2396(+)
MSDYLDPANEELLKDFFMEAQAQVDILERNILVLENDTGNKDSIDEIFRAAHTLKGNSAAVEMFEISEFTHVMEDLLDEIRSETVEVDSEVIDILLESIDIVKIMIEKRISGEIYEEDISEIKENLKSLMKEEVSEVSKTEKVTKPEKTEAKSGKSRKKKKLTEYEILELMENTEEGERIYNVKVIFNEDNPMNTIGGIQVFARMKELSKVLSTSPDFEKLYEDNFYPVVDYYIASEKDPEGFLDKILIPEVVLDAEVYEINRIDEQEEEETAQAEEERKEEKEEETGKKETKAETEIKENKKAPVKEKEDKSRKIKLNESTILKVESKRIDSLLNLVSETVINKATFNQISSKLLGILDDINQNYNQINENYNSIFENMKSYLKDEVDVKEAKNNIFPDHEKSRKELQSVENELKTTITKLVNTSQNFGRITNELHESVLQIRMVPISQIFSRFPRLVRDVSKKLGKKINLIIEGEDTELDKSVIEQLLDPLIHCVRNSMDHGVETPEERKKSGKNEEGTVVLKAKNEGNMILIEISDDGNGIDVESVKQKAIDKEIIHPGKNLTDLEAFNLIFEPGFSTASSVTDISGRGVGLDVVRRQIEKLNGSVTVWSEKGNGTVFTIKLPLTLAIIQGLLVRVGEEIYAIPITSVIESQRIFNTDIKVLDNYEVFNVREDVVSIIRLNRLFGIKTDEEKNTHYTVIVGSGDKKIGLMVDQLIGEEDVVIKPLKDKYTNVPGIAGATILGDGKVSLILDVSQLLELCYKNERAARERKRLII